jgi:hypothetical protein
MIQCDDRTEHLRTEAKELIPIIVAAAIWEHHWAGRRDNMAVVSVLNSRGSRDPHLMQMLRCFFFIKACHQREIEATLIPGAHNDLEDDLSRNSNLALFQFKLSASDHPPLPLLQWLLHPAMD